MVVSVGVGVGVLWSDESRPSVVLGADAAVDVGEVTYVVTVCVLVER